MTDTPLAFDLDRLIGLLSRSRPIREIDALLSRHAILAIRETIGDDPNPLRAAAILSRALGQPHLYVYQGLTEAALRDRIDPVLSSSPQAAASLELHEDSNLHEDLIEVAWVDGPSVPEMRGALAPLFEAGLSEVGDIRCRRGAIDADGRLVTLDGIGPPNGYQRGIHHAIHFDSDAGTVRLARDLSRETLDAGMAALTEARRRGELPEGLVFRSGSRGVRYDLADREALLDRMDAIVRAATGLSAIDRD